MANDTPEWLAEAKRQVTTAVRDATLRDSRRRATAEVRQARGEARRAARAAYPVFIQEGSDAYLSRAGDFYLHWKPYSDIDTVERVSSMQQVVEALAARQPRSIGRFVIVSHAEGDGLTLPFLQGGENGTRRVDLEAPLQLTPQHEYFSDRMDGRRSFLDALNRVRAAVDGGTTIELWGCVLGGRYDMLRSAQQFFGGRSRPKVRSPKHFLAFGHYGWDEVRSDKEIEELVKRPDVKDAYDFWAPELAGRDVGDFGKTNLWAFLRRFPLPLGRRAQADATLVLRIDGDADRPFARWIDRHGAPLRAAGAEGVPNTPVSWLEVWKSTDGNDTLEERIYRPHPHWSRHIGEVG